MWRKYFKFIKLVPGRVKVKGHGVIDFSKDNLSIELLKTLHDNKFPYLKLTEEGKEKLYGIQKPKSKQKKNTSGQLNATT